MRSRPDSARDLAAERVLLIDCLDSQGSRTIDAAARGRALALCAGEVEILTIDLRDGAPAPARSLAAQLAGACARLTPDRLVIASALPCGRDIVRAMPRPAAAVWWPTGLPQAPRPSRAWTPFGSGAAAVPSLHDCDGAGTAADPGVATAAALDWAVHEDSGVARARITLWDGRYLLAPVPLSGVPGHELLRAFAALDARWNRVELVVLGAADPAFHHAARRLGIGARLHFAGAATADAELTWLASAAGAMFATDAPVAASLIVRAIACGTPVFVAGSRLANAVNPWLAHHGTLPASWPLDPEPLRVRLESLLDHDHELEVATRQGRAIAARHQTRALSVRLAVALGRPPRSRAA